jgi:hypothetical protein
MAVENAPYFSLLGAAWILCVVRWDEVFRLEEVNRVVRDLLRL